MNMRRASKNEAVKPRDISLARRGARHAFAASKVDENGWRRARLGDNPQRTAGRPQVID